MDGNIKLPCFFDEIVKFSLSWEKKRQTFQLVERGTSKFWQIYQKIQFVITKLKECRHFSFQLILHSELAWRTENGNKMAAMSNSSQISPVKTGWNRLIFEVSDFAALLLPFGYVQLNYLSIWRIIVELTLLLNQNNVSTYFRVIRWKKNVSSIQKVSRRKHSISNRKSKCCNCVTVVHQLITKTIPGWDKMIWAIPNI